MAEIVGWRRERTASMISLMIDPLQVSAGRPQVGMPELALDDRRAGSPRGQLDGVGMPQLVLVPTSAQPPLSRPARYGDLVRKSLHVGILMSA